MSLLKDPRRFGLLRGEPARQDPRVESAGRLRLSIQRVAPSVPGMTPGSVRLFASSARSGAMGVCIVPMRNGNARFWRFDADGGVELTLELPPYAPDHQPSEVISSDTGNGPPWRVSGFTLLGSEDLALAYTSPAIGDAEGQGLVVRCHASDGHLRWTLDNWLESLDLPGNKSITHEPEQLRRPWPDSTVRMAYGRSHLCVHLPHEMRWPDGSMVQGGFARSMCLPTFRSDRAHPHSELAGVRPWFGSRSIEQRCAFDPHRGDFVLAALSDAFPRAVLVSRLGRGSWRDQIVQWLPGEPGAPDVAAELGGLVPLRESCAVSFTSAVASQPESRDMYVGFVIPDLRTTPLVVKVTNHPPGTYAVAPKLAAMGRHLLAAWTRLSPHSGESQPMVAVVTPMAQLMLPPQPVRGMVLDPASDLFTDAHGAVNWFALHADGLHWMRLRFARGPQRLPGAHEPPGDVHRKSTAQAAADDQRGGRSR